jgi:endonuclease YncB( thermonuclease family)
MGWTTISAVLLLAAQGNIVFREPPASPSETEWPNHKFTNRPLRAADTFACTVTSVTDGDTFRCSNGVRVRLSSIDTPEMPGSCRRGRKCAPGNPFAARAALSRMIAGQRLRCEPVGRSYDRVVAWCSVGSQDLSCAMLRNGHAVKLPQRDRQRRLCR